MDRADESRPARIVRRAVVAWLRLGPPVLLALVLERALPRLATADATLWALVVLRLALVGAGLAIAQRLREPGAHAWSAVTGWAVASIAMTLIERAWPALPSGVAPSEARVIAAAAIVRDAALAAVAAWRAHQARAEAGQPRDSS